MDPKLEKQIADMLKESTRPLLERIEGLEEQLNNDSYTDRDIFRSGVEFVSNIFIDAKTLDQITANQDDYEIGGSASFRLSTDASRNITGFANPTNGRLIFILNTGSFDLVLQNENVGSVAANRIICPGGADITLSANDSAMLWYDIISERWRIIVNS